MEPKTIRIGVWVKVNLYPTFYLEIVIFLFWQEGAQTSIYLSVSEDVTTSGEYYADCRLSACSPDAQDPHLAKQVWARSAELVQLELNETFI